MQDDDILGKAYDNRLMKRLLGYIAPYRRHVLGAIALTILISAMGPVRPYLTKIAIDDHIAKQDSHGLLTIVLLLLATLIIQGIVQYGISYFTQWIGQHTILDLRMQVFRKLQQLSLGFFDRNPVGRMVTRVTSDVEVLNEMFSSGIVTVFSDVFIILWIVGFMFFIDWGLALVTLSVMPLLVYGTFLFRRKVRESYRDVRAQVARLNSFTQEFVSGITTVQLYGREKSAMRTHRDINAAHTDANVRSVFYYAVFYPGVDFLHALAVGLAVWYAGGHILSGMMTVGTLISFIQYTEMFFRPVRDLAEKYNILQSAMASSERIFQLLDEDAVITEPDQATPFLCAGDIAFRQVWFAYTKDDYVLKDLTMTIPEGSTAAIVGATGSGKTTIINLISRFYEHQRGEILIGGRDIRSIPSGDLRRHIGIVLQDVFLFSGSIRYNITLGRDDISDEQVRRVCTMIGIDDMIMRFPEGYDTMVKERGATLSVGQKQLISFARALVYDPEILVLDEATSNIDTESELLIQRAIDTMLHGRTSIVIAHRLSTIQNANRIFVMHKGQLRESGSHQELLTRDGIYARLYRLQYREQELRAS